MLYMNRMNILFFTKGDVSIGSSRQRVWYVAQKLQAEYGWNYEVIYGLHYAFFSFSLNRFRIFRNTYSKIQGVAYKILFVHKSLFPWDVVLLLLIARYIFKKKLIYDLDDAEWLHSPLKSWLLAKAAHMVFCGSHEILRWAGKLNARAVFVPTVLDTSVYGKHEVMYTAKDPKTIGWVGRGQVHFKQGNFHVLKNTFDILHKKGKSFRFVVLGAQHHAPLKSFFSGTPYEVIFVDGAEWENPEAVPTLIQKYNFDVGVMPLVDNPFNRAKCAFKILEYMACGVPAVASPVGENTFLIQHEKNGFLANSVEEWVSVLEKLLGDEVLRERIGKAGQETVKDMYSYENIAKIIHDKFSSLV